MLIRAKIKQVMLSKDDEYIKNYNILLIDLISYFIFE